MGDVDALEKLDMPGMSVLLVDTAPHLPASPSFTIRLWNNDGLEGGTHQLVAEPIARTEINRLRAELKEAMEMLGIILEHPFAEECQECAIGQSSAFQAARAFLAKAQRAE
jgi:hypothetical protein